MLDLNEPTFKFVHLGSWSVSPDSRYLAYTLDTTGNELYSVYVKDLVTGNLVEECAITGVEASVTWANDSKTLFYLNLDEIQRA
jgi:oligopeptidase B